jgi:hypothetical protein
VGQRPLPRARTHAIARAISAHVYMRAPVFTYTYARTHVYVTKSQIAVTKEFA